MENLEKRILESKYRKRKLFPNNVDLEEKRYLDDLRIQINRSIK